MRWVIRCVPPQRYSSNVICWVFEKLQVELSGFRVKNTRNYFEFYVGDRSIVVPAIRSTA